MKLARELGYFIPKNQQVPVKEGGDGDGLGLKCLCRMINFPLDHHRALSDTEACYYLHRYFVTGKKIWGVNMDIKLIPSKVLKNTFELWIDGILKALLNMWEVQDLALSMATTVGWKVINRYGEEL